MACLQGIFKVFAEIVVYQTVSHGTQSFHGLFVQIKALIWQKVNHLSNLIMILNITQSLC